MPIQQSVVTESQTSTIVFVSSDSTKRLLRRDIEKRKPAATTRATIDTSRCAAESVPRRKSVPTRHARTAIVNP